MDQNKSTKKALYIFPESSMKNVDMFFSIIPKYYDMHYIQMYFVIQKKHYNDVHVLLTYDLIYFSFNLKIWFTRIVHVVFSRLFSVNWLAVQLTSHGIYNVRVECLKRACWGRYFQNISDWIFFMFIEYSF